jgi:HEPN domain-containing protein
MTEQETVELDVEKIASFWLTEAEEALEVADHLIAKADYSYALFFGHLAVEKMLKSLKELIQWLKSQTLSTEA